VPSLSGSWSPGRPAGCRTVSASAVAEIEDPIVWIVKESCG